MSDNQYQPGFDPMLVPGGTQHGDLQHGAPQHGAPQYVGPAPAVDHRVPTVDPRHDPDHPEFEDPYYDASEWEPLRRRSPFLFRAGFVVVIIGFALITSYRYAANWVNDRVDPPGDPTTEVAIVVPSGATADDLARILAGEGVVPSSLVTSYYWRFNEAPAFQAGEYVFRMDSSVDEVRDVLQAGPLPPVFNGKRIVFPEGFTVEDIEGRILDEFPDFDPRELASALDDGAIRSAFQPSGVNTLEGLLFPATYEVNEEELRDERAFVQKMVQTFDGRARALGLQNSEAVVGYTPYEVLVIASLIEKEARLDEDRAKIARVIYNRLAEVGEAETYGLLQIDATLIYALGDAFDLAERNGVVLNVDKEVDSPYNTYVNAGLPPGPIASPGEASIRAALFPEPGDWRYYVLVDEATGAHAFAETYQGHINNGGT